MKLDPVLLDILVCPDCKGSLSVDYDAEELICDQCGLVYPVRDDIPVMLVDEARRPEPPTPPEQPEASEGADATDPSSGPAAESHASAESDGSAHSPSERPNGPAGDHADPPGTARPPVPR